MSWIRDYRRRERQQKEETVGADKPTIGYVTSSLGSSDRVNVNGLKGIDSKLVLHPFLGSDAWIRVMPDRGSQVLEQMRGDVPETEIIRYFHQGSKQRIDNYAKGLNTYRPLESGEMDFQSTGRAGVYFSKRGNLHLHGGAVYGTLSRDELEIGWKAPTHVWRGAMHTAASPGDQMRFGVVKRPSSDKPNSVETFVKNGNTWAKEYSRSLKSKTDPTELVSLREGNVIADDGTVDRHSVTGQPNRLHLKYGTTGGGTFDVQLDERGNLAVQLPPTAEEGIAFKMPGSWAFRCRTHKLFATGHSIETVALNKTLSVGGELNVGSGQQMTLQSTTALIELKALLASISLSTPRVNLGIGAGLSGLAVARVTDGVLSTVASDATFWAWVVAVSAALNTLLGGSPVFSIPPAPPLPGQVETPTQQASTIIEGSPVSFSV